MTKYTIEDLKTKKIAVHLPTQEEYNKAMVFLEKNGIVWSWGTNPTENNLWERYKEDFCIATGFQYPITKEENHKMGYDRRKFYKEEGYTIITLDQINLTEEKKTKYIKTHEELLKLHGRKVSCKVDGRTVEDARIFVDGFKNVFILQNISHNGTTTNKFGYKHSFWTSSDETKYEKFTDGISAVSEIQLLEEENIDGIKRGIQQAHDGKVTKAGKGKDLDKFFEELSKEEPKKEEQKLKITDFIDARAEKWAKEESKSNCCKAPVKVDSADEGTCCHICIKCGEPCDIEGYDEETVSDIDVGNKPTSKEDFKLTEEEEKQAKENAGKICREIEKNIKSKENKLNSMELHNGNVSVINGADLSELITITKDNFQSIKEFLEGSKEGSRMLIEEAISSGRKFFYYDEDCDKIVLQKRNNMMYWLNTSDPTIKPLPIGCLLMRKIHRMICANFKVTIIEE